MNNTITALATAPGISGLAVVRVSGNQAIEIVDQCFVGKHKLCDCKSHTIHYGKFIYDGNLIDTVTVSIFKSPNSYTGEDVIEISSHGGMLISDQIIHSLIELGCSMANPGEFTRRAFMNGKLDLTQVEAVADMIHSISVQGTQTAARQLSGQLTLRLSELRKSLLDIASLLELELDFSDEDLEFIEKEKILLNIDTIKNNCNNLADSYKSAEILRSGFFVGIAGFPNSGKSTLFNTLVNKSRAIVSDIPGTTRDYIEETIYINGIAIKFIDTAGIRDTKNIIEIEGIRFVDSIIQQSNIIIIINDITKGYDNSKTLINNIKNKYKDAVIILVQNKIDKIDANQSFINDDNVLYISAKSAIGIEELKHYIYLTARKSTESIKDVLINQRQAILLKQASECLNNAQDSIRNNFENEIISIDIRQAALYLGEITGESWNESVLNNIFSRFCIGK